MCIRDSSYTEVSLTVLFFHLMSFRFLAYFLLLCLYFIFAKQLNNFLAREGGLLEHNKVDSEGIYLRYTVTDMGEATRDPLVDSNGIFFFIVPSQLRFVQRKRAHGVPHPDLEF